MLIIDSGYKIGLKFFTNVKFSAKLFKFILSIREDFLTSINSEKLDSTLIEVSFLLPNECPIDKPFSIRGLELEDK